MLQEIITYMIIGAAVAVTIMKFAKRFGRKKAAKKAGSESQPVSHAHNCGECSAECQLRDLPRVVIEQNSDECIQIEKKSKLLQS
jgi:predicted transglutaminase-like cysteine proteinase